VEAKNLIPTQIFCPKCGGPVVLAEMTDAMETIKLIEAQYSQGARGQCSCGVMLVLLTKPLPVNPTFTILCNVYRNKKGGG